jgi:hypothetical protein
MMGTMSSGAWRTIAALSLSLVWGLGRAQDSGPYEPDPPDRAARLSLIRGDVSMQPAGEQDWAPALLNRPLTTGDKLWTEPGARAEIQVGESAIRLADSTGFSFLNVDDDTIQMRITAGIINVSVRALEGNDHIEIDTPNVALSILRPGIYRVEVNDAGDVTTVKITEGEAQATGPSQDVIVHARQVAAFRGFDELTAQWSTLGEPDEFDSWSLQRDDRAASSRTAEYVNPDVTGYEDLDDHGSWSSEPEYGYVWTPRHVAVDWSPYRYGRWVWVSPWGWTWIDDAPWGYAPFHYGRWAHIRHRWCWVPGPRHVRAVYAPALVGWFGSGGRVSWFPLGPREIYVPGRRFSHRYVDRVNVTNTVIVDRRHIREIYERRAAHQAYRNRAVRGAVTAMLRENFASAARVNEHRVRVDDREVTDARVIAGPQIQPARESRLGGAIRANARIPPRAIVDRPVVVHRDPPPSAARFARRPGGSVDASRTQGHIDDRQATRNRPDRPAREPATQTPTRAQPGGADPRSVAGRTREDRPPRVDRHTDASPPRQLQQREQDREQERQRLRQRVDQDQQVRGQQQRERDAEVRQRVQQQQDHARQQRDQQRQQNVERQATIRRGVEPQRERNVERPRAEPRQQQGPPPRSQPAAAPQPAPTKPAGRGDNHQRPHRQ